VRQLHSAGIAHVVMLTGDNRITAEAIAREVGIDEYAELPEDKVRDVEELVTLRQCGNGGRRRERCASHGTRQSPRHGCNRFGCGNRDGRYSSHDG
jgi:magnesium-transporting ATPase (P-type)